MLSHSYGRRKGWASKSIIYYSNSTATFCLLLIGDLVFKLNPGLVGERIDAVVSIRKTSIHSLARPDASRNTGNLITVNCSVGIPNRGRKVLPLTLCSVNACSVKSKSADFIDLVVNSAADLVAITETWLTERDSAARVEIIPPGYQLINQPRPSRAGGGIALLHRGNISIKKISA